VPADVPGLVLVLHRVPGDHIADIDCVDSVPVDQMPQSVPEQVGRVPPAQRPTAFAHRSPNGPDDHCFTNVHRVTPCYLFGIPASGVSKTVQSALYRSLVIHVVTTV
jgi:hypothetical protein